MSDSELSDAQSSEIPADSVLEATLRKEVTKAAKGPLENYTVSKIRRAAETLLELPDGFFKEDRWKARSKSIIEKQVEVESAAQSAPEAKEKAPPPRTSKAKSEKSAKRPSADERQPPVKKQKLDSENETSALSSPPSGSEDDFEEPERPKRRANNAQKPQKPEGETKKKPKASPKRRAPAKRKASPGGSEDKSDQENSSKDVGVNDDSDSEMSVVLDDAPVKKPQKKSRDTSGSDKKSRGPKRKASTGEVDPDQEEIKKLQGWLTKCGIRKVWGKELKQLETSKAKIKHLKGLLADVGMTGRYSNEKAAQIKEARELAADIEAVQEGNERWGKSDDEDGDSEAKTRGGRRLVRGAKNYDFLSSDGEETD